MNKDYMEGMSPSELDIYGKALGIEMSPAKSKKAKIALIEKKRNAEAVIETLGLELHIPKKRASDKRVSALLDGGMTDSEAEEALKILLGEEQMEMVVEACTDEDGTVDTIALGVVFANVFTSEELKNL